jgi:hypothetical protein
MSKSRFAFAALAASAVLVAACGNKQQPAADNTLPLAFAPADTPYAFANLEPSPAPVLEAQSRRMQMMWPSVFGMYDDMLANAEALPERPKKIARALIDELRTRDTLDKLREIGVKPDARYAVYGVGLVPVARIELGDPAAFKATIARIEAKIGEQVPTGKTGAQDYWQLGNAQVTFAFALEGTHLVATFWPADASDAVKQALLGVTRPARTLADAGTLQALAKQYGYLPYGEGYIDAVALVQRLSTAPSGSDLEIAKALQLPTEGAITDPVCKAEILGIAQNFPRLVVGTESLTPDKVTAGMQLEMAAPLAKAIADTITPAPGSAATSDALLDVAMSLPLLKIKDFWIKQAEANAAKPYACPALAGFNRMFHDSRAKLDTTIPPPLSEFTGARFVLTKFAPPAAVNGKPDFAGKVLYATSNPLGAVGMAQLALPGLKDVKITPDGNPIALPANIAPAGVPPLTLAVDAKAIALAAGKGEETGLHDFLTAPAATTPVWLRMRFSGTIYGQMSRVVEMLRGQLPAAKRDRFEQQQKLYAIYEKMLRSIDFRFEANAQGVAIHEVVEMNAAP